MRAQRGPRIVAVDQSARDTQRTIAIQCVAELARGALILEHEVTLGRPRRELMDTIRTQRKVLQLLETAALRDGRPA